MEKTQMKLSDGSEVIGEVYCRDPVSGNIVLLEKGNGDDGVGIRIIPESCVLESTAIASEENLTEILACRLGKEAAEAVGDVEERKQRVLELLKQHRIVVDETTKGLSVMGVVDIASPFTPDSCISTNELVLSKVRKLLESLHN